MQDVSQSARCEAAVASFKDGSLSRTAVTLALHAILTETPPPGANGVTSVAPTSAEAESYMEPYIDMCDQWERDQEAAKNRGKRSRGSGTATGEEGEDDHQPPRDDDDEDNEERPTKRRHVFEEEELPWVRLEALTGSPPLRADLAETVRLLGVYAVDPKRSLRSLLARTRVEFPESQWLRLLTNRAIDLDAVLTGIYSVSASTTHTESVGDIDLTFNSAPSRSTRVIVTQSDWTIAWMQTVQAGLTVFPHLSEQYRHWGLYILGKFAAVHESSHQRVINFEKAGRLLASRRADVALDELFHFSALETMHLNSMGRLAMESSSSSAGRSKNHSSNSAAAISPPSLAGCGTLAVASATPQTVATSISAPAAERITPSLTAPNKSVMPPRPRYLRSFIWSDGERHISQTALGTETDPPFPGVPLEAFENAALVQTVIHNPRLFRISSPIDVDLLERLLSSHPNQPLVSSFCKGLREGFWPWSRPVRSHPVTLDGSKAVRSDAELAFLMKTRDEEVDAGRFSEPFPALLPGMHAIAIHAVPKPHSEKLRLVTNFSGGDFSRNSTISRFDTNRTRMDGIRELSDHLRELRRTHGPDVEINIFKSDVKGAFKVLPMHILWQPWQVYRIAGKYHVDRAATFGCSASPPIWTTFAGFVLWIAMVVYFIPHLFAYMDDFHSAQLADDMLLYKPYNCLFPRNQTRLLLLWDALGIPHSGDKQLFGHELVVIGFLVDSRRMRVTIPDDARTAFLAEICRWTQKSKHGVRRSLREWQALAGYTNWIFNVFPLLKPSLCNVYAKMEGKDRGDALIFVSDAVRRDLSWLAAHVASADGVLLIKTIDFDPRNANLIIYCDASTHGDGRGGMGFYFPSMGLGYQSELPAGIRDDLKIFFYEALCVCSALHRAATFLPKGARLTIYTDSSNSVDIFNSLKALPAYNDILKSSVDVLLLHDIELRVLHVPGKLNSVADAISRWKNSVAVALVPGLSIHPFTPPRDALGAAKK